MRGSSHRSLRRGLTLAAGGALAALSANAIADVEGRDASADAPASTPGPQGSVFWIDAGGGYQQVDLTTFRASRGVGGDSLTANLVPSSAGGPSAFVGAGVRLLFVTLGLRGSMASFEDDSVRRSVGSLQLYSVDAEVGLDFLQIGRVVPSIVLGAGYTTFGGLDDAIEGVQGGLDVDGVNLRARVGVDYYVTSALSFGARFGGDVLFLSRPGVPLRSLASPEGDSLVSDQRAVVLRADGSSVGTGLSLTVGPALHF